ncbi:uncharacterized protein LOC144860143 [Branchiostoma floridae x Branchiostoma japonicum]
MAQSHLHNYTGRQWSFEVDNGEVNANIDGIDYRIDVVQVGKSTRDDTVAIHAEKRHRDKDADVYFVKVKRFVVEENLFCQEFRGCVTADQFCKKWDTLDTFWTDQEDTPTKKRNTGAHDRREGNVGATTSLVASTSITTTSNSTPTVQKSTSARSKSTPTVSKSTSARCKSTPTAPKPTSARSTSTPTASKSINSDVDSEDGLERQKRYFVGHYDIPIHQLVEPSWTRLVRVADPDHVQKLKTLFLRSPGQTPTVLVGNIPGVSPADFSVETIKRHEVEVLGGNHTRMALQEILREDPDALHVREVHMNLFCNVPDDMAKRIGLDHNNNMNYSKEMTFIDKLVSYRSSLFHKADHTDPSDVHTKEPTSSKKIKNKWRDGLVEMLDCEGENHTKKRKTLHDRHGRTLRLASMPRDVWLSILAFAKKWERGEIVGQSKSTVVRRSQFDFLDNIKEENMVQTLRSLADGELNYKDVMTKNKKKKNKTRETDEETQEESREEGRGDAVGNNDGAPDSNSSGDESGHSDGQLEVEDSERKSLLEEIKDLRRKNEVCTKENVQLKEDLEMVEKEKVTVQNELKKVKEAFVEEQSKCMILEEQLKKANEESLGLLYSLEKQKEKGAAGVNVKTSKRKTSEETTSLESTRKSRRSTTLWVNSVEVGKMVVVKGKAGIGKKNPEPWYGQVIANRQETGDVILKWFDITDNGRYEVEMEGGIEREEEVVAYSKIVTIADFDEDMTLPKNELLRIMGMPHFKV